MRILSRSPLCSAGSRSAGCDSFDPLDKFQDWDIMGSKKPLPGERRAVFPEGVPGVPQGVPPDMVKGYQPPRRSAAAGDRGKAGASRSRRRPPPRRAAQPPPQQQPDAGGAGRAPTTRTQPVQQGAGRMADHAGRAADLADRRAARAGTERLRSC